MKERSPMTVAGHKKLQAELHFLKGTERVRLSRAIEEARAHGDLSENAEYHAAKEAQGLLEAKIRKLESLMATAQVVDVASLSGTRVIFGATVDLCDVDSGEQKTLTIVGEEEADVDRGLISYSSPVARALIGKEIDDVAAVSLPGGRKEYEIVQVRFEEPPV